MGGTTVALLRPFTLRAGASACAAVTALAPLPVVVPRYWWKSPQQTHHSAVPHHTYLWKILLARYEVPPLVWAILSDTDADH
ncbi:hypothetical protein [Candidatus Nitrotoga arctica]|uniref:hypothetical protein n=1 Tax=Candidatus Nitrotoga arctica TaxID=453162 RepID=UPI001EFAF89D|nr:hypothetical protein [Candidatus Nitrotoga arctica]